MTMHYEISATPGIDEHIVRYWYNPTGTRYAAVRGAGTMGFTTTAYYDPVDRPASMHNGLPGTANDLSLTFAYNPASQIVTSTRSNDAYAWNGTVPPGTGYAVNGQNQYTSVAGVTYLYDANGNLTSDGASTFTYDVENRLVAATGAKTASLVYDPLGRLFQTSGGAAGVTQFLYDGDALVAEYNASGALLKRHIHGPGADEPVAVYEGPAQGLANRRYTLPDERGSIAALINADGTPSVINSYDPWGVPGTGNAGRFQYTGQAWIAELGMYHYKARIYSPTLGRFLQTDPIGYDDQINLYAYVANDPVNMSDPTGKAGQCDTGSRIDGNSSFCMVAEGYAIPGEAAPPPPRRPHGPWAYGGGGRTTRGIGDNGGPPLDNEPPESLLGKFGRFVLGKLGGFVGLLVTPTAAEAPAPSGGDRPTPSFPENRSQTNHIFRNAPGHYPNDTPANREALINTARFGQPVRADNYGNQFLRRINRDGTETWVQVRNGIIQNGGLNRTPRY